MRDLNGVRYVQAIIVSNSTDPAMTDLRAAVLRSGGAIHAVHPASAGADRAGARGRCRRAGPAR